VRHIKGTTGDTKTVSATRKVTIKVSLFQWEPIFAGCKKSAPQRNLTRQAPKRKALLDSKISYASFKTTQAVSAPRCSTQATTFEKQQVQTLPCIELSKFVPLARLTPQTLKRDLLQQDEALFQMGLHDFRCAEKVVFSHDEHLGDHQFVN